VKTNMDSSNTNNLDSASESQVYDSNWLRNIALFWPKTTIVLNGLLDDIREAGVFSEDQIAGFIAKQALPWPVPDQFLQEVRRFVVGVCKAAKQPDRQTLEFIQRAGPIVCPHACFVAFRDGEDHYYYDELPEEIIKLRETVLFWINRSTNDFFSDGERCDRHEWLPPQAEKMLRFLCLKRNAGRVISLSELYLQVWQPVSLPSQHRMCNSIDVAQNAINTFAAERFIISVSDESKQYDGKVARIRGANKFKVGKEASVKCCIIKKVTRR